MAGRQRNYTLGERAIRLIGKMAGRTNDEISNVLEYNNRKTEELVFAGKYERDWSESSLTLLEEHYVPVFKGDIDPWNRVWEATLSPPSFSDLNNKE